MTEELIVPDTPRVVESESESELLEWYISTLTDYIFKMTLASVLFLITYPWTALFWPPYYFRRWNE
jgi:hypothetical protein